MSSNADDLAAADATGQQQQTPIDQVPPEFRAELQRTRGEAAKYRRQNGDIRKMLSTVLGEEVPEGSLPPDQATVTARFEKMIGGHKTEVRELKMRNGLLQVGHRLGVEDVDVLHAVLSQAGSIKDLSPDEPTFMDDLEGIVAETLENKPVLKGGRPSDIPSTTGARFTAPPQTARQQLTRQDLATMTPEQVDAARSAGLLDQLLGRR